MSKRIIAIDGPSASGKSTVSRRVAEALGYCYVDSGALYRGVTWQCLRENLQAFDAPGVLRVLEHVSAEFFLEVRAVRFTLNGSDPGQELRSEKVVEHVSVVAAIPEVRAWVVERLRDMTRFGDLVMEGRDIGTVVFPSATFKFYLDADEAERAQRRLRESRADDLARVQSSIGRRDRIDRSRKAAPLRVAEGAIVIDTTNLDIDGVVRIILDKIGTVSEAGRGFVGQACTGSGRASDRQEGRPASNSNGREGGSP